MIRFIKFVLILVLLALPMTSAMAQSEEITLSPVTDESFGYQTLAPDGWTPVPNTGLWERGSTPTDTVVLAQQSAPFAPDQLMEAILPQLALETAPDSIGTFEGEHGLVWTLYKIEVEVPQIRVTVDLALTQSEAGKTYLVLLQAPPEEYDALHAAVFEPILAGFAPLVVDTADLPYVVEEVSIPNGEVTLSGTLTLPEGEGPFPVVVLVSGSGPQDRNEDLGAGIPLKPFLLISDHLTRNGIAVLRYDDRGVGRSTGDFNAATTVEFASDAQAALDFLTTRPEINQDHLGLLGHSEGGLVAAKLAASDDRLDFVINLAGPSVLGRDVMILQNQLIMGAAGATPEQIDLQVAYLEEVFGILESDAPIDIQTIEQLSNDVIIAQAAYATQEELDQVGDIEAYAQQQASASAASLATDWFQYFLFYDPSLDWAQTTIPVLTIYGGKDLQVPDEQNAQPFEDAMQAAGNTSYEVIIYPNANHLMQEADTGAIEEYGVLPAEFTPDFLPDLTEWILQQVQ